MRLRTHVFIAFILFPHALNWAVAPGAADAAGTSGSGEILHLETLVCEAMERNPEILAARRAVDAKRARIPQARAWADPTVSFSYGGNLLPLTLMRGDPSSARQLMAEQTIPYPGKTRLRTEIAARDADAETLAYEAVGRRVAAEVKQAYFDLAFVDRSLASLQKDREALEIRKGNGDPLFRWQSRPAGCFEGAARNHAARRAANHAHTHGTPGGATQQPAQPSH